jgi:hypothetical protein
MRGTELLSRGATLAAAVAAPLFLSSSVVAGLGGCSCGTPAAELGESCESATCVAGLWCDPCALACAVRPVPGEGPRADFVSDTVTLPAVGETLGCDLDGNSTVDNDLGYLLAALGQLIGPSFDAQAAIDASIASGTSLLLWRLDDVGDFTCDWTAGLTSLLGTDADADPGNNFGGAGTFVAAAGGAPAAMPVTYVLGGHLYAFDGEVALVVPLGTGLPLAAVDLVGAAVYAETVGAAGLGGGLLCGAVPDDVVRATLWPIAVLGANLIVAGASLDDTVVCMADVPVDGQGTSAACTALSPTAVCSASNGTDPGVCIESGGVAWSVLYGDANGDGNGVLSLEELEPLLSLIFQPDLDLDTSFSECRSAGPGGASMCGDGVTVCGDDNDCRAACDAVGGSGCAGVRDAYSFALRFTAVPAMIQGL